MSDLIDLFVTGAGDPAGEAGFRRAVAEHAAAVRAATKRGDRRLVAAAERAVQNDPAAAFSFDAAGRATLAVGGHRWAAGRFEAVAIGELRRQLAGNPGGRARLWVMDGGSPVTDIGSLQATAGPGTLFQVASQFNCLESPGPYLTDVAKYFHDHTQGPRASVSAFPATLLRHYAAPAADGCRFVQKAGGPQIELLADATGPGSAPNGYFNGAGLSDPTAVVAALEANFGRIRVGLHDRAEVVLGGDWDGGVDPGPAGRRLIAQAFTSTVAAGGYDGRRALGRDGFVAAARQLLRAAYLGTLLGAAAIGCRRVVLALIGGGVFGNPIGEILAAIRWSLDQADPLLPGPMDVVLNGYNLGSQVDLTADVLPLVRDRGGVICRFEPAGGVNILR